MIAAGINSSVVHDAGQSIVEILLAVWACADTRFRRHVAKKVEIEQRTANAAGFCGHAFGWLYPGTSVAHVCAHHLRDAGKRFW